MIRRVKIAGYKSLQDVEISLQALTIFIGPNAAGKSNLFDALGLLSRMVTSRNLKLAFDQHRGAPLEAFFYGQGGIEGLMAQKTAKFTMEVDVELSPQVVSDVNQRIQQMREGLSRPPRQQVRETYLRYALTIQIMTDSGHLRVLDEQLTALNQDASIRRSRAPFVEKKDERLHLRMEGQSHPTYHDVGLDHPLVSTDLYAPHYPHITAFKEEMTRWRFYYLEPQAMRADTPIKEIDTLEPSGADLAAFYNTLRAKAPRQYQAVVRALDMLLPTIDRLEVQPDRQGMLQLRIIESGVPYSARVMSEGTLRILALLAIITHQSATTIIGYEEPENGVHPRRIKLIADMLKNAAGERTQVIVNTHSPILPRYFDNDALIICRKQERGSTFVPFESLGGLFREGEVDQALEEQLSTFTERIIRGDFDG